MQSRSIHQQFVGARDPFEEQHMIEMAPIQMFVFGFHDADRFTPAIIHEVEALQNRGLIRLIDLLYIERLDDGGLITHEMSGLTSGEVEEFGSLLERLLGASDENDSSDHQSHDWREPDDGLFYGISSEDMAGVIEGIPRGGAAAIALFEHTWAFDIRNKIREASGYPIAQGFLTPEFFMLVGEEARMMHDAAHAMQIASELRGAALLDALDSIIGSSEHDADPMSDPAAIVQSSSLQAVAGAAATVRALIDGNFLSESAAENAINYLVRKNLIDSGVLTLAEQMVDSVNPN